MDFEAYLISKKIESAAFRHAEQALWSTWKDEFEQVHPKSFTAQKLYLINPIRRKYPLKQMPDQPTVKAEATPSPQIATSNPVVQKPKVAMPKPMFKPKPKTD